MQSIPPSRSTVMDRLQTMAFLQWLTDEEPFEAWRQEGFDLTAWIKANGFDPGGIACGLLEVEKEAHLLHSIEELLQKKGNEQEIQAWISTAKTYLSDNRVLMNVAGGKGMLMPINNLQGGKQTRRNDSIELQERVDEDFYHQAQRDHLEDKILVKERLIVVIIK